MNKKASHVYHLNEFCDGGNKKPNDALTKVKCISGSTLSRPAKTIIPPVSKGGSRAQKYRHHDDEGVASQRA
jgi:hypothetical protein